MDIEELEQNVDYEEMLHENEKNEKFIENNYDTLKDLIIEENPIFKSVLDNKYKKVSIIKDKKSSLIIEGELIIFPSEEISFIKLQKKYPNGEIKAISHHGKILRYEIVDRIRIEK